MSQSHSHSVLCHTGLCCIRGYVVRDYVAFGVMSLGIMLHSGLCRLRYSVIHANFVLGIMLFEFVLFGIMSFF